MKKRVRYDVSKCLNNYYVTQSYKKNGNMEMTCRNYASYLLRQQFIINKAQYDLNGLNCNDCELNITRHKLFNGEE